MDITTDNKPRPLITWHELPDAAQAGFDYVPEDDRNNLRFVKYQDAWYDIDDTQAVSVGRQHPMGWAMHVEPDSPLAWWDRIVSDSFFSGVLFRFAQGCDEVIVGRYCS